MLSGARGRAARCDHEEIREDKAVIGQKAEVITSRLQATDSHLTVALMRVITMRKVLLSDDITLQS